MLSLLLLLIFPQDLSKAINGDGKTAPTPLFKVNVVLDGSQVQFEPSYDVIAQLTERLAASMTSALDKLPRLPSLVARGNYADMPYRVVVESDDEIKKLRAAITAGLNANAPQLKVYAAELSDFFLPS